MTRDQNFFILIGACMTNITILSIFLMLSHLFFVCFLNIIFGALIWLKMTQYGFFSSKCDLSRSSGLCFLNTLHLVRRLGSDRRDARGRANARAFVSKLLVAVSSRLDAGGRREETPGTRKAGDTERFEVEPNRSCSCHFGVAQC